jgi:hypothetical protein
MEYRGPEAEEGTNATTDGDDKANWSTLFREAAHRRRAEPDIEGNEKVARPWENKAGTPKGEQQRAKGGGEEQPRDIQAWDE